MKHYAMICIAAALWFLAGCANDESATGTGSGPGGSSEYFPFSVGRSWTYNTSATLPNGSIDPNSFHRIQVEVFQMNQSIGGHPNATILKTTDLDTRQTDNLVFDAEPSRLWAYLSPDAFYPDSWYWIWFSPGYSTYVDVGVGANTRALLYGGSPGQAYYIMRSPNTATARAQILGLDTLSIDGVALGSTSCTIARTSAPTDSMVIRINVYTEQHAYGPPASPWMLVWQSSTSTADRTLYRWDSTFTLVKRNGVTIRDHVTYSVTARFVGMESLNAAGGTINAERHSLKLSLTETIDTLVAAASFPVFSGVSYELTGNLWIAAGTGLVKGEVGGTAHQSSGDFDVSVSGRFDAQGRLINGHMSSPRLSYSYYGSPDGTYEWEYLDVDTRPAASTGSYSFTLASKNF